MREKVFRNSSGFRFNVSFVDCTSVFVKSVLETSLSFVAGVHWVLVKSSSWF